MTMSSPDDPRPLLERALVQASDLIANVSAEQLSNPTPCPEFDVAALLNHMTGAVSRMSDAMKEKDLPELETSSEVPAEGFVAAFADARENALSAVGDDSLLAKTITLPWASLPGSVVIGMYALETVLHSWDLAVATSQADQLDDVLASAILPIAKAILPVEPRDGEMPFESVVEVGDDAKPVDQLAAYSGRRPPG